eukprot:scaffold250586_cov27-Tisochrysis_lutea.AAC.1
MPLGWMGVGVWSCNHSPATCCVSYLNARLEAETSYIPSVAMKLVDGEISLDGRTRLVVGKVKRITGASPPSTSEITSAVAPSGTCPSVL